MVVGDLADRKLVFEIAVVNGGTNRTIAFCFKVMCNHGFSIFIEKSY